jgi:dCMP deaminase
MQDKNFITTATLEAIKATCLRDKCGAVVVKDGLIIGKGWNGPAGNTDTKCGLDLVDSPKPKSDRSCCVHAEWRAIMDAIRTKGDIAGSSLYFARVDDNGTMLYSGAPYCTVCSRLALDSGIAYFVLAHESGIKRYDTKEYNDLSYQFHMKNT